MGLSLDGLASGLDTTTLIKSLLDVERIPQNILLNKAAAAKSNITALQSLNTRATLLTDLAGKLARPAALDLYTAVSSSPAATATAAAGASAGSIDFTVDKLASTQSSVSEKMSAWPDTALTITGADGTAVDITAASAGLDDIVKAVNASTAGVTATKVAAGDGTYRLQFTAKESGTAGAFTVSGGTGTFTEVRPAQDAELTLWGGTAAEQKITSASNEFKDLLPGVNVTVTAPSTAPVSLSISRDDAAVTAKAEELVKSLNDTLNFIKEKSAASTGAGADGNPTKVPGVFGADSTIRTISDSLLRAASAPASGISPSEYGISITKYGTMEFSAEKFQAALAKDPAAVESTLATISSRLEAAGKAVTDKYSGTIPAKITSQETQVRNLNDQVSNWDRRLATREAALKATYAALEVAMQSMNSQMASLASSLSNLPSNGSSEDK